MSLAICPEEINDRFTISMPDKTDRLILCAVMNTYGVSRSAAVRIALRAWALQHNVLPETLIHADPAAPATCPPTG